MYQQDSFFDLSQWGQVGLALISLVLFAVTIVAARRAFYHWPLWLRIISALVVFWVFVWASPQIYYQYYWFIFPNLPMQWVIWPPPPPTEALDILTLQARHNLSNHGKTLLGWTLIASQFAFRKVR